MREKLGLTLVNLIDPDSETIRRYGILNEQHGKIPHPATLVVDRDGIVRFVQVDVNFMVRPANDTLVQALETLQGD